MKPIWKSWEFLGSQVLFLVFALVSFVLHHRGLSFFDASDFATAIQGFGIPHAPGYPLYVLAGKVFYIFTSEPFEAQFWVNILSAWIAALFLFLTLAEHRKAALMVGSFLFTQGIFQQYILVPEVFTLNLALASMLIYFHKRFEEAQNPKWLFSIGVVYGLGVCHHHLLALMVPASIFLLCRGFGRDKGAWAKGLGLSLVGFLLGLLPLSYLFVMTAQSPDYSYYSVRTFSDLLFVVLRQGYGTFKMTGSGTAVPVGDLLQVIGDGIFRGTGYLGVLLGLGGVVGLWRGRKSSTAVSLLSLSPVVIFIFIFCALANFPIDTVEGKNAFIRYLSFPSFLMLYPLAFACRWLLERWGSVVLIGGQVVALGLAGFSFAQLDYRHYPIIDYQIESAYHSIHRVMDAGGATDEAGVDSRYGRCVIFTVADPLHFGGRYYNEFQAQPRCYFYSVATVISGQFQSRVEQMLMQQVLGEDYPLVGKTREAIHLEFLNRVMTRGYRVFFLYAGDLQFFRRPDLLVTPVGPVLELIPAGREPTSESLVREYGIYLESLKLFLDEIEKVPRLPRTLSASSLAAPFANLDIYPQLVKAPSHYQDLERELRRRAAVVRQVPP